MKPISAISGIIAFTCLAAFSALGQARAARPVVIGYLGGYRGRIINMDQVSAGKLTHVNYAFINVKHNRAILSHERTDTINLKNLAQLKKQNPDLKILISLGGWSWSSNFSDAVLTDTSRRAFASSAVAIATKYNLDGVDIDWEYPGMRGNSNNYRKADQENYTLMFAELRRQLDSVEVKAGKKMLLTTATGGFKNFLNHTEIQKVAQLVNYINLMTYDYFGNGRESVHHTNLYTSSANDYEDSADKAVKAYLAEGVPSSKLVMGIAFYGRLFQLKSTANHGLGDLVASHLRMVDYAYLKDSLINRKGFIKYQDTVANAPYLFNPKTQQFITYDDEWSVDAKCRYALTNKLAGVMFWEYDSDPKDYLLDQIGISLKTNINTKPKTELTNAKP